jgi:hypothetical protein
LLNTIGCRTEAEAKGRNVFALRCYDAWSEPIEGIEADGCRFVKTRWWRANVDADVETPQQRRLASVTSHGRWLADEIAQHSDACTKAYSGYVDWESER